MEKLIREADVLVENFAPGAMDRMGLCWDQHPPAQPAPDLRLRQGLQRRIVLERPQGLRERRPVRRRRRVDHRLLGRPADRQRLAALGDSNTGMHLMIGILTAIIHRDKTGMGQKVSVSMQDAVLNLCRVKLRDQQRLEKVGYLEEYPQYPNGEFGDAVPRGGNAGGGGQPGWIAEVQGLGDRPQRLHLLHGPGAELEAHRRGHRPARVGRGPRVRDRHGRASRTSSRSSPRSRSGWPTRPSTRRSTSCASGRSPARRSSHEGTRRGPRHAQERHHRRGRAEGPRHLPDGGQPDQVLELQARDQGRPAARRARHEVLADLGYDANEIAALREKQIIV